jgi:hypothetical protein
MLVSKTLAAAGISRNWKKTARDARNEKKSARQATQETKDREVRLPRKALIMNPNAGKQGISQI